MQPAFSAGMAFPPEAYSSCRRISLLSQCHRYLLRTGSKPGVCAPSGRLVPAHPRGVRLFLVVHARLALWQHLFVRSRLLLAHLAPVRYLCRELVDGERQLLEALDDIGHVV